MKALVIRPVRTNEIHLARQLILDGLVEHWGWLDETQNPDLQDIPTYYAEGVFLVALLDERLVGTGALIPEGKGTGRIVRMTVDKAYRRKGIGRQILYALIDEGRLGDYQSIVLETTAAWVDAIAFYKQNGFRPVGEWAGDVHFVKDINGE